MSSPTESFPGINLSKTFSPIYWGFVISLLLGGASIVQAYIYFLTARRDRYREWVTALCMLLLDLASSALVAQSVYYYLIPHFGSTLPLNSVTPELSAECLISTIITFISQMYFVYQLYIVQRFRSRCWIVYMSIAACAVIACAGGIACVATMYLFRHGVLANRNKLFSIFFGLAKGFGSITDLIATIAMCTFLTSSMTDDFETNSFIRRIVVFVIHRGILVTLIQTLLLVAFYAAPNNLYWFAFHVNVTKLYAITFFAMLNGRQRSKDQRRPLPAQSFTLTGNHSTQKDGSENDHYYDVRTFDLQSRNVATQKPTTVTKTVTVEITDI